MTIKPSPTSYQSSIPRLVTLSGADSFFIMLDKNNEKLQRGHNVLRICLFFDTVEDANQLVDRLRESRVVYWMCNIRLIHERTLFCKPKWLFTDNQKLLECTVHHAELEGLIPEYIINTPLNPESGKWVACDKIHYLSGKCAVVFSWHHAIMDGRGSGLLLESILKNDNCSDHIFPTKEREPNLYHYIRNMYRVKHFMQNSSRPPLASLTDWKSQSGQSIPFSHFYTNSFSLEDTKKIDEKALETGARFGAGHFLLASCALAYHTLRKKRNDQGVLWIPVPYDGRKRGSKGPVISNHIAFLFYRLQNNDLSSLTNCVASIKEQMIHQIKEDMPKKYDKLLGLMRYFPLWLYQFLTTRSSKGSVSSFLFSSAGEDRWDMNSLTLSSVKKIQLIPPSTVPPGLTFSFLRNNNQLTMNILWSEAIFNEEQFAELKNELLNHLLG
jgi:hypothetical protein